MMHESENSRSGTVRVLFREWERIPKGGSLRGLGRGEVSLGVEVKGGSSGYGLLFFVTSFRLLKALYYMDVKLMDKDKN